MANPNRVVGQMRVKIDGTSYPTSGESSLEIGGPVREAVAGDYDASAFKESTAPSKAEVTINYKAGISLSALRAIDNATLTMEADTGVTWIVRNAYVADVISFGQDGKAKLVLQGPPAEEMV